MDFVAGSIAWRPTVIPNSQGKAIYLRIHGHCRSPANSGINSFAISTDTSIITIKSISNLGRSKDRGWRGAIMSTHIAGKNTGINVNLSGLSKRNREAAGKTQGKHQGNNQGEL